MALVDLPDNPIPSDPTVLFVTTRDRVKLRCAHWPPTTSYSRGTVTVLQGRAECIEKYFEVINDLRERGFAVVAFDWRGQGGSQRLTRNPNRGHVSNFRKYRIDLETVLKEVSLACYPGPHFALAHSTGGLVLLTDTVRLRTMLDRAVIVAPLLALPRGAGLPDVGAGYRKFLRTLTFGVFGRPLSRREAAQPSPFAEAVMLAGARILTWTGFGRMFVPGRKRQIIVDFEENIQTSDRVRYERGAAILDKAPELGIGAPTFGWLYAACRAMRSLRTRNAGPNIKLPCLVLGAGEDKIVSTPAIEEFVSRTKAAGYLEIAGAEHELMMERDHFRDQFWAAFDAFVPGLDADLVLRRASGQMADFG